MLKNIEAERARMGLAKVQMAKELDIALKTYYNWINETTDIPSSALINMSKKFNKSVDYLLEGSKVIDKRLGIG